VSDKAVAFDLSSFVSEAKRVVSIVIIPGTSAVPIPPSPVALPGPGAPPLMVPTTFDVTFKPVTSAAVAVLASDAVTSNDFGSSDTNTDTNTSTNDRSFNVGGTTSDLAFGNPTRPTSSPRGFSLLPRQVATQVGAVKAVVAGRTERTIAAVVFLLLCVWAWSVANRSVVPGATGPGRPFRTLYDGDLAPHAVLVAKQGFSRTPRNGRPPSLR